MATSRSFGFGGGQNQIDLVEVAALMILPITASMIFGVFSFEISVFGEYDITEPIWTLGGADISVALLVTILAIIWVVVTNIVDQETDHSGYELGVILVALALPLGVVFVPAVESLVFWNDLAQLAALLYTSAATVAVAYLS